MAKKDAAGKKEKRKGYSVPPSTGVNARITAADERTAAAADKKPSTGLTLASCLILIILAAVPYGPFHVIPAVELWPLIILVCAALLLRLPAATALCERICGSKARTASGLVGEAVGLFIIFTSWLLLKLVGLHPSGTDDNIYFYLANRVAQGAVPYRDFFFSHPPVHLLLPALIFKIFGYSIGAAKLIPILAQTIAGLFLYLTLRRASVQMALIGLFAHFSAYQILMGSTDMNGENMMTMFIWASVWFAARKKPLVSGVFAGLALGCGMYALAAVMALAIALFVSGRKPGLRFLAGFGALWATFMAVFGILGGASFFNGVFLYHIKKPVNVTGRSSLFDSANPFVMLRVLVSNLMAFLSGDLFKKTLYYHGAMFTLTCTSAAVAWYSFRRGAARSFWRGMRQSDMAAPDFLAIFSVLSMILFLFQWAAVNEVYDFYLVPMLSLMCPAVAYAAHRGIIAISKASSPRNLVLPVTAILLAWAAIPISSAINSDLWPEETAAAGEKVTYEWRDPDILKGPAQLTKALFFVDHRLRGEVTPFYRHYMWNKSLTFSSVDEIADYIRNNTSPEMTISGASTLAPLVALHADRRIAGDEADTNGKRFKAGMITDAGFRDIICNDKITYLISASGSYFTAAAMDKNFSDLFAMEKTFMDPELKHFAQFPISLYKIKPGAPCGKR